MAHTTRMMEVAVPVMGFRVEAGSNSADGVQDGVDDGQEEGVDDGQEEGVDDGQEEGDDETDELLAFYKGRMRQSF